MTTDELRALVESHRATLKEMTGQPCEFSVTGPVSMYVVDALVATLEAQQKQIDELRSSLGRAGLTVLSPCHPGASGYERIDFSQPPRGRDGELLDSDSPEMLAWMQECADRINEVRAEWAGGNDNAKTSGEKTSPPGG